MIARHLRSLKISNDPTEHWDSLIVYHVSTKLDNVSSREWEKQKSSLQAKQRRYDERVAGRRVAAQLLGDLDKSGD